MYTNDTVKNPWLEDYEVGPLPRGFPPTSLPLGEEFISTDKTILSRADVVAPNGSRTTGAAVAAESRPGVSSSEHSHKLQARRYIGYVLLVAVAAAAASAADGLVSYLTTVFGRDKEISHSVPVSDAAADLFAVRLQIRSTKPAGRAYLRRNHPDLSVVFEHWNSPEGLFVHGEIPRPLPSFIPEARPGREAEFAQLVFLGLSSLELHAFPYTSEQHLYMISSKCGLPSKEGVAWIKTWSTWRQGPGETEESVCRPGGWCVLLTRGCYADAFN